MSEFRQNLATKEWVILAPERRKRPQNSLGEKQKPTISEFKDDCPFCPGHEDQTDQPIYIYPSKPPWQVRVVPNKYAALQSHLDPTRRYSGRFLAAEGFGIAEVVIEHPRHNLHPALMSVSEITQVLTAYRQRQIAISASDKINLVTIFRNHGSRAGTSLEHPHSQIIATPIVPPHVRYPMEQAVLHYDKNGTCVYCDMYKEEIRQGDRIILDNKYFVAFCPYAARSPYECRIYPKRHIPSFIGTNDNELADLAVVLRDILIRLNRHLGDPDYNYIIRSAPVGDDDTRHLHWYLVIIPKISTTAGFEIGSGIFINTVPPEQSARELREVAIK